MGLVYTFGGRSCRTNSMDRLHDHPLDRRSRLLHSGRRPQKTTFIMVVGQTSGRGRMDREHQRHGQAIKDIYVYPLVRDARQRLCGDPTRQGAWR